MALTPQNFIIRDETVVTTQTTQPIQPSKTWGIDFENGTIGGFIDGDVALQQFVRKALMTERNKYTIYTDAYGNELFDLIGDDVTVALMDSEIPRMVEEALIYDDRIDEVQTKYTREGDKLFINETIIPLNSDKEITEEVEINV